jgi:acyl dehydratase
MATNKSLADLLKENIGEEKTTDWIEVTQDRINKFADCTEDHQYIHVDIEKAKKGPFGQTIAHGFLTLSLIPAFSYTCSWLPAGTNATAVNYGLNKVRFINPVPAGSKVRDIIKLTSVEDKGNGRTLMTLIHTISVQGADKPALIAEGLSMIFT